MVDIPKNVLDLMNASDSVKVLTSACKCGQPHAIVVGSVSSPSPSQFTVGEVMMKVTSKNMGENDKAALLVTKGGEAYIIEAKASKRVDSGPMLDGLNEALAKVNLKAKAVWVFDATAVFDEGAGPNAGKKLA